MEFALGPKATAAGYRVAGYETIGSTNAEALERARAGDPGRLWLVTDHQTAGRGRRSRAWSTPRGNLASSILLVVAEGPAVAATLGFVAGLALVSALGIAGVAAKRLGLKWPNDVLLDGRKLAGILLEAEPREDGFAVAVGIGVNVAAAPEGMPYPVASLATVAPQVDATRLFALLADAWAEVERIWNRGRGFDVVRKAWLAQAAGLGHPVTVSTGDVVITGTFETIDSDGRLILRSDGGERRVVSAGDVHFGMAATVRA